MASLHTSRDEYIGSQIDACGAELHVSSTEIGEEGEPFKTVMLIQVENLPGVKGKYSCIHLTDEMATTLVKNIQAYLSSPED